MTQYIKHSKSSNTSASLGWHIKDDGRSCPPPSPVQHVVDGIPFRDGEVDIDLALGLKPTYPMRELSYVLFQQFGTEAAARSGMDALTSWLASCRGAELTDTCGGCVFTNVSLTAMKVTTDDPTIKKVEVTLKANPYRKDGSL